jgi:hypothetical protein
VNDPTVGVDFKFEIWKEKLNEDKSDCVTVVRESEKEKLPVPLAVIPGSPPE